MTLEECSGVMSGETGRDLLETKDMRNFEDLFRRCCGRSGVGACCWPEGVAMLPNMLVLVYRREFRYTSQCMLSICLGFDRLGRKAACRCIGIAGLGDDVFCQGVARGQRLAVGWISRASAFPMQATMPARNGRHRQCYSPQSVRWRSEWLF